MKEYIEKDSLVGVFLEKKYNSCVIKIEYGDVINLIQKQPKANVQEVVYCKDCKHIRYSKAFTYHDENGKHIRVRDCPIMGRLMKDDDFCSCGAKMDKE